MPTDVQYSRSLERPGMDRVYAPDILPRLQSLLADLADIDFVCEQELDAVERSEDDESLKRRQIAHLRRCHQERRAPYVAALENLQERIRSCFE